MSLADALCSRLCHDLIGPLNAVTNGVELVNDDDVDPETVREALALIAQSASVAARRLQMFRLAFGMSSGLTADRAQAAADAYVDGEKLRLHWNGDGGGNPLRLRLALLFVILADECLPYGGDIRISVVDTVTAEATGRSAQLRHETAAALDAGDRDSADPRSAPAQLALRVSTEEGMHLSVESTSAGCIRMVAKPQPNALAADDAKVRKG